MQCTCVAVQQQQQQQVVVVVVVAVMAEFRLMYPGQSVSGKLSSHA
jgi:hypothetical protein